VRRRPARARHRGRELEPGYLLRRGAWDAGPAFEAATAVLCAAADELADEPVIILALAANERSPRLAVRLGFRPVSTFVWFDAEQTLSVAGLHSFKV
jgi:RimJ/RimL family protein N-acetyltransferase